MIILPSSHVDNIGRLQFQMQRGYRCNLWKGDPIFKNLPKSKACNPSLENGEGIMLEYNPRGF